ncbi:Rv1733c family protein [Streptomyces chromofuscus]|uniref:Uncharacterized protein n=1 Tax=Streptomyces chromofuscus TaxID=42881 RepID=A0A7M2T986_STRCW|nr:hypothetical protein [Streptomyces chromofuscus]QOV45267.1 hypothetical protein IPT68_04705 [Streptomyces chromofuscus]GGS98972.1 hypothetical protein GCM10010254_18750 [Streptomyces chromofuscus]
MAFRGPKVWLWRWRRNPLRRRSDRVEAWVLLGAWALAALVGVLAGATVSRTVEGQLARERVEWRTVEARLTEPVPGPSPARSGAPSTERVWAEVRWPAPDGSDRSGQARVRPGSPAGTPVTVWTDRQGRLVTEPTSPSEARVRADLTGTLAGVGAAAVPLAGARLLRGRLERGRLDQWEADWARFDALWRRQTG